jgi:hypothetical protein
VWNQVCGHRPNIQHYDPETYMLFSSQRLAIHNKEEKGEKREKGRKMLCIAPSPSSLSPCDTHLLLSTPRKEDALRNFTSSNNSMQHAANT